MGREIESWVGPISADAPCGAVDKGLPRPYPRPRAMNFCPQCGSRVELRIPPGDNLARHVGELFVLPFVGLLLAGAAERRNPSVSDTASLGRGGMRHSGLRFVSRVLATLFALAWLSTATLGLNVVSVLRIPDEISWLVQPWPLFISFLVAALLTFVRSEQGRAEAEQNEPWVFREVRKQKEARREKARREQEARRQQQPELQREAEKNKKWFATVAFTWAATLASVSTVPLFFADPPVWSGLLLWLPLAAAGAWICCRIFARRPQTEHKRYEQDARRAASSSL